MTTKTDMTVATEIKRQLGNKCLAMIGAKNIFGGEKHLQMKLGRNAHKWTHLTITLNDMDTYDLRFIRIFKMDIKNEKIVSGVYADMLHNVIEDVTGMYTSL